MGRRNGPKTGGGRRTGIPNKNTAAIKDMILKALEMVGGEKYLATQAKETPAAFLSLLGKIMPLQVTGAGGGPVKFERIERVIIDPQPVKVPVTIDGTATPLKLVS